jgi:DMSO/TMAO reductase YedYZ molybdopterin-dependent catalytic subunit
MNAFRSPLRGPWLTAVLGTLLLVPLLVVAATGFASHAAYQPDLGANAIVDPAHDLQPFVFAWPASPSWLYALTQGLHVTLGIVTVPLLLAKLWSVIPRLFAFPPVRSPAQAIERLSLLGVVGGAAFEFATGILNVQLWYPWHFDFVRAHYYGAWVFLASLTIHVAVKLPMVVRAYRQRGVFAPLRDDRPEPFDPDGLAPREPAAATLSRRGLLALVGGASAGLLVVTAGQSVGGPLRSLALLAPRGEGSSGAGLSGFPVNKTAAAAGIMPEMTGAAWQLAVVGGEQRLDLGRDELLALPQHTYELPIACVEGWSTSQHWTGVRLAELAAMVGAPDGFALVAESLQTDGRFRRTTLGHAQASSDRALIALHVNGADLSPDHGYPARLIVPAVPGVHCTKWLSRVTFARA